MMCLDLKGGSVGRGLTCRPNDLSLILKSHAVAEDTRELFSDLHMRVVTCMHLHLHACTYTPICVGASVRTHPHHTHTHTRNMLNGI